MTEYHKIQSMFKRDMTDRGRMLIGEWTCPEFEYLAENEWAFTEKVDGTNLRVMFDGERIAYGGKTDNAQLPVDLLNTLHAHFDPLLPAFAEQFSYEGETRVCFYGEGYGAGIQKGGCYRPDKAFVLFDIKIGDSWLLRENVEGIATQFGMEIVPVVGQGPIALAVEMARSGFKSHWGDFIAEGLVLRPATELFDRRGHRIITKIKHGDFRDTHTAGNKAQRPADN